MNNLAGGDLLRIVIVSGLAGFLFFCGSYGFSVWSKRNRTSRTPRSLLWRFGFVLFSIGLIGGVAEYAFDELTSRPGVVDGADLYVVHAKREATIQRLATEGRVEAGEIIAELKPPSMEGTQAVLDNQIKESQARIAALQARALPIDQVLGQQQAQMRVRIDQHNNFYYDLMKAAREFERDHLSLLTGAVRDKGQLETELYTARMRMETLNNQIAIARQQQHRAADLRNRGLLNNYDKVEEREQARLALESDKEKNSAAIEESKRRLALLEDRYKVADEAFKSQRALISKEVEKALATVALLSDDIVLVENQISADRTRAKTFTEKEIEAATHQLNGLIAEKNKNLMATQVRAPFSGQVVYRHPSPGLADDNVPILAISAGSGFNARIWMSPDEVRKVASAGQVQFAIENAVLTKYFSGQFHKLERPPYESRLIANFDVQLPIEAISRMGTNSGPLRVRLLWKVPIFENVRFRCALFVALLGLALLGIGGNGQRRGPLIRSRGGSIQTDHAG
jgi:hypothetical protein